MFNSKQIDEIIKKLSSKSKMYEYLFINYVSKNILKTKCLTLNDITKLLRERSLYGTKFIMSAATARAGGEQAGYGKIICEAIDKSSANIGFKNLNSLRSTFLHVLETIEDRDITSIFVVAEPATKRTNEIIDVIANNVTGVIYLKKGVKKIAGKYYGGTVVITPNVGHTEGQFSDTYKIEPYQGVIVELSDQVPTVEKQVTESEDFVREYDITENEPVEQTTLKENKPEIPQKSTKNIVNINAANVYSYNDFSLILNNQIALFKSAGQKFNLVSFSVSKALLETKNISFVQIKAAIVEATERREKVCYIDDIVLVLIPRSTDDRVAEFILDVKAKLISYGFQEEDINSVVKLFNYEVDDQLDRADTILEYLTSPTTTDNLYISLSDFLK